MSKNHSENEKSMFFTVDPHSPEVKELLKSIEDRCGKLSEYLRWVHDFAIHFSNIDIEDEMKSKLYFVADLANIIQEIEITSKPKK